MSSKMTKLEHLILILKTLSNQEVIATGADSEMNDAYTSKVKKLGAKTLLCSHKTIDPVNDEIEWQTGVKWENLFCLREAGFPTVLIVEDKKRNSREESPAPNARGVKGETAMVMVEQYGQLEKCTIPLALIIATPKGWIEITP